MKNKDKKIRELEEKERTKEICAFFLSILLMISIGFILYYGDKSYDLNEQLQSCQEGLDVEEKKLLQICYGDECRDLIECKWFDAYTLWENCEVIK